MAVTPLDPTATGQVFVQRMMLLLAGVVVLYLFLHVVVTEPPPVSASGCTTSLGAACFATVDELGDLRVLNPGDVDWYVGARTALEVREQADANSEAMDVLRRRVASRAGAHLAPLMVDRAPADALRRQVTAGRYGEAQQTLDAIVEQLASGSANERSLEIVELAEGLDRLVALEREQHVLASRLTPPLSRLFFWTSPVYSMLEVLFWALFGVLTNLLVNATEYLRKGTFQPRERWVAYTKLLYGPIFGVILVLAMLNGFFEIESYEVRVWTLPLVSFLFGYASRRTARLIDRLLERFLGAAEKAIDVGPGPAAARRQALVDKLMDAYRPSDLQALRAQAKELAREIVEAELDGRAGR
jgi:hypothetical protein